MTTLHIIHKLYESRGVGTGAAGAAKAAPIIFAFFKFIYFIFLHFNLVGGLSTLVQVLFYIDNAVYHQHTYSFYYSIWLFRPNFQKISRGRTPDPLSHFCRTNVKLLPMALESHVYTLWHIIHKLYESHVYTLHIIHKLYESHVYTLWHIIHKLYERRGYGRTNHKLLPPVLGIYNQPRE